MKSKYIKPIIAVETLSLGGSIASNCTAKREDMDALFELDYFNPDKVCEIFYELEDDIADGDAVCYHSNIQTAFYS